MAGAGGTTKVPSLPPPRPKSPPEYPDLYGKRRELARVQMMEREIRFLEDEVKFVDGLQPASRSCKEVADFITANSDLLMPTTKRARKSCHFWNWLWGSSYFNFSWICCRDCTPPLKMPQCCQCNLCDCISCISCSKPECNCRCCYEDLQCCQMTSCSLTCCIPKCPSCPTCHCEYCTSCFPKCPKVNLCSCCTKNCRYHCFICY